MKSAYLYVRVSTDEQKRKGYSLPEQEDRLIKYCEYNNILVKGIFREDFSAKTFNRPEWTKLLAILKKSSSKGTNNVLFVKWDRFSRNVEFAYEMIGILRKYKTTAAAIDQPVDFGIPESSLMHAVYLAIPQAENERRSLNTKNGLRRARQMGRYVNKAPVGYINQCAIDGKKSIAPHRPDAALIKWSFQQIAKNAYCIEDVRRMANAKGLKCSKSNFWRLLHNPVYYGYVSYSLIGSEERQLVKGTHEPIITEALYNEVQNIINTKRKIVRKTDVATEMFMLHRYLICPICNRVLYSSCSKGRSKRYPYYHCKTNCRIRFKTDIVNQDYKDQLKEIKLSTGVVPLFDLIAKDTNVNIQLNEYLNERKLLLNQIKEQDLFIAKARKLFFDGKIEFDDFFKLKKEHLVHYNDLNDELNKVMTKVRCANTQLSSFSSFEKTLHRFNNLNVMDKKHIINFIPPGSIDVSGNITLQLNHALSKILTVKKQRLKSLKTSSLVKQDLLAPSQQFAARKVTTRKAMEVLGRNNISIDENEAAVILDFLYLIAKFSKQSDVKITHNTVSGNRTAQNPNRSYCSLIK